jgi:integrase
MEARQHVAVPPEITFLTQDEVRHLLAVSTGTHDRALFQLAYHHGLRASEEALLQLGSGPGLRKRNGAFIRCAMRSQCICSTRVPMWPLCRIDWNTRISRTQ